MNDITLVNLEWHAVAVAALCPLVYGYACIRINKGSFSTRFVGAFLSGFAASYIAFLAERALVQAGFIVANGHVLFGFVTYVAVPEETVKLAALLGFAGIASQLKGYGLLLACFIGCGFAASENIIYLERFGSGVVLMRFFTATAFHVFNAVLMARVLNSDVIQDGSFRIITALFVAVGLHGAYDFLLVENGEDPGRFLFVLAFCVGSAIVSLRTYQTNTSNSASPA